MQKKKKKLEYLICLLLFGFSEIRVKCEGSDLKGKLVSSGKALKLGDDLCNSEPHSGVRRQSLGLK